MREELTIPRIHELVLLSEATYRSITQYYLDRISKYNHALRAVIEINPDAIRQAQAADEVLGRNKDLARGMFGIPVLIKDNISTRDKMQTCAGSLALEGAKPRKDAFLVKKLRDAGGKDLY